MTTPTSWSDHFLNARATPDMSTAAFNMVLHGVIVKLVSAGRHGFSFLNVFNQTDKLVVNMFAEVAGLGSRAVMMLLK